LLRSVLVSDHLAVAEEGTNSGTLRLLKQAGMEKTELGLECALRQFAQVDAGAELGVWVGMLVWGEETETKVRRER
jgi:hypothetical protein